MMSDGIHSTSPAIHTSSRTPSAIGMPMAKITNGMQSAIATAPTRSPTTTAARRNGPGTTSAQVNVNDTPGGSFDVTFRYFCGQLDSPFSPALTVDIEN